MKKDLLTYVIIIVVSFAVGFITIYHIMAPNEPRSATMTSMQNE